MAGITRKLGEAAVDLHNVIIEIKQIPAVFHRFGVAISRRFLGKPLDYPHLLAADVFTACDVRVLLQHLQKLFRNVRVKLLAGAPADLILRFLRAESFSVRTVVDHGVIGIHHRDHARQDGNVLPGNMVRVSLAVPLLMVTQDQIGYGAEFVRADGYLIPLFHMGLQDRPFLIRELTGLVKDLQRHAYLSYIVQKAQ